MHLLQDVGRLRRDGRPPEPLRQLPDLITWHGPGRECSCLYLYHGLSIMNPLVTGQFWPSPPSQTIDLYSLSVTLNSTACRRLLKSRDQDGEAGQRGSLRCPVYQRLLSYRDEPASREPCRRRHRGREPNTGGRHELRGISHFWRWAETRARPLSAAAPPPAFTALPDRSEEAERQAYPSGATRTGR